MDRSAVFFILFVLLGCEETIKKTLHFKTLNNHNSPIEKAKIVLNNEVVGYSDHNGDFKLTLEKEHNFELNIEIFKDSESHYYAPFFEKIIVNKDSTKDLKINGILYQVEIPHDMEISEDEKMNLSQDDIPEELNVKKALTEITDPINTPLDETKMNEENQTFQTEGEETKLVEAISEEKSAKELTVDQTEKTEILTKEKEGLKILDIYTFDSDLKGIEGVEIYWNVSSSSNISLLCTSNKNGRCLGKFLKTPDKELLLISKKNGYLTKKTPLKIKNKKTFNIYLSRGTNIDIFALTEKYGHVEGLSNIGVYLNHKFIGYTDEIGHKSITIPRKTDDILTVSLKSSIHLPEVFETKFMDSPSLTLVKYFNYKKTSKEIIDLLDLEIGGLYIPKSFASVKNFLDKSLLKSLQSNEHNNIFSIRSFINKNNSIPNLLDKEFRTSGLFFLLPKILLNEGEAVLELSIMSHDSKVLASAYEKVKDILDKDKMLFAFRKLLPKVFKNFPWQATVLETVNNQVKVNFEEKHKVFIDVGDKFTVFSTTVGHHGKKQDQQISAQGVFTKWSNGHLLGELLHKDPLSMLQRGDTIILGNLSLKNMQTTNEAYLYEDDHLSHIPVEHANVYQKGHWISSSDKNGKTIFPKLHTKNNPLYILKAGFKPEEIVVSSENLIEKYKLTRVNSYLKVESYPPAEVYLNDIYLGKTPVNEPVEKLITKATLSIKGPPGYRSMKEEIDIEKYPNYIIDLGFKDLRLDLLKISEKFISAKAFKKAIEILAKVDLSHPDYKEAKLKEAEILLENLNKPEEALIIYKNILDQHNFNETVKNKDPNFHRHQARFAYALTTVLVENHDIKEDQATQFTKIKNILSHIPKELLDTNDLALNPSRVEYFELVASSMLLNLSNNNAKTFELSMEWNKYLKKYPKSVYFSTFKEQKILHRYSKTNLENTLKNNRL